MRVISRTSAMHYKGTRKTLPDIARELNVDAIVEGSVQRSGNRVQVRAELIQAVGDRHLWAESYDGDSRDILTMQNNVARAIANQVQAKLTPQERLQLASHRPVDPEAHEAYLKGRYFFVERTPETAKKSVEYFQQSTKIDPDYAVAYAGLSDSLAALSYLDVRAPREIMPKAKAAAARGLQLDGTVSEAHVALGMIALTFDWDWAKADMEFKRAIELDPNNSQAHQFYAAYFEAMGRLDEAIREAEQARQLDPLSVYVNRDLGRAYYYARQYDRAIQIFRETAELNPKYPVLYSWLGGAYEKKGMEPEAFAAYLRSAELGGATPETMKALKNAYATSRLSGFWRKSLELLKRQSNHGYTNAYHLAGLYVRLRDKDQAFRSLETEYDDRSLWMIWLKIDPVFDSLHSDPRFQDLIRRVGLPK